MSTTASLELISFKICPFVQRAVIALNEKKVEHKVTHLEPGEDQPEWFRAISPMGKVPVLLVNGAPIFESAVILEYLDEVYIPRLHPADHLEKARQRAWMEFSSELLSKQYQLITANDETAFKAALHALQAGLQQVNAVLAPTQPYFAGSIFALVDTTYAPLFMRLQLLKQHFNLAVDLPERVQAWSDALLERPSIKKSVVKDFDKLFSKFVKKQDGYLIKSAGAN